MKSKGDQKGLPPVAVVSMAGVFPGAGCTDDFLTNILENRESIIRVPESRWIAPPGIMVQKDPKPDRAVSDRAGLITNFQFDPHGFLIDKDILAPLDLVHHLVLHTGQRAFEDCYSNPDLKQRTGVILAAISLPTDTASDLSLDLLTGKGPDLVSPLDACRASVVSGPAAILARAMGLGGGSFTLDAACASSLVALKLACEHLSLKKADIMVAGGVSRPDSLYTQVGFSQLKALSASGCCAPFDRNADGLVVGEGCGIMVLKRLEDALECGDNILGIIRGAGVSNDIEGNLVGPASEGQIRAMAAAYESAGWTPDQIEYMECHGTGTPVGDRVETQSIKSLLDIYSCPDHPLSIGSVKSMVGHLLTAANAASFIKTLGAMNRKFLPPSLNFSSFPENSPLAETRVRVQTKPEEWKAQGPGQTRKAAISGFGFGGINAHILVEEYSSRAPLHFVPAGLPRIRPCAVIGMDVFTRDCQGLADFSDLVFGKKEPRSSGPGTRWLRDDIEGTDLTSLETLFMEDFSIGLGEFHIPPNQMEDILAQHLILLKAAKGALEDAGISPRPENGSLRTRTGCAIGIDFDFNAANFFLRWNLEGRGLGHEKEILDILSPPLTFNRTLGALGGIVASRAAREFQLGGPCFTLSAGPASGMKAVETALISLGSGETDTFICGCVDMAGDFRHFLLNRAARPFDSIRPTEGAGAIVLKPLDQALRDGDRIYGLIQGTSGGSGSEIPGEDPSQTTLATDIYRDSLESLLTRTHTRFRDIAFMETATAGTGPTGRAEARALGDLAMGHPRDTLLNLGSSLTALGDGRTVSGLFSIIKTALCLHCRSLPGNSLPGTSAFSELPLDRFSLSQTEASWEPDRKNPKRAVAAALTPDGTCAHVLLEEAADSPTAHLLQRSLKPGEKRMKIKTGRPPLSGEMIQWLRKASGHDPQDKPMEESLVPSPEQAGLPDPGLIARGSQATARAHEKFLEFSRRNMALMEEQFAQLTRHAQGVIKEPEDLPNPGPADPAPAPLLDRDKCLEFAVGKAGDVLGPEFDIIDTYPVRVRLPAEPLMLVDRIMAIEGKTCSLGPGKIITQHDVKEKAWYLDGGKAPVSISIEAGQADLFLCSYLGIDHAIQGRRKYRLLDAKVTFHRELPNPGETIEYHIEIDRFLKQGEIYLFFFHYRGFIQGRPFISMREGCAGFFTEQEVENSGGIILTREDQEKIPAKDTFAPLVKVEQTSFSDEKIEALRRGNLEQAFGPEFRGVALGEGQRLPGGRMHLIDRVLDLNSRGGRFGMGSITAEADIHPDDWFLTCHFIDDMVMPGTLMYECCAHALRIFVQRMGWISPDPHGGFDVLPNNESDLKCRGPVTPATRKARYEIEIKEMGYDPQPYVIADAHMFSDGLRIVLYRDMGMRLAGVTRQDLEDFWRKK
ncbi:beta-ketoacyl synthase N-terminal-like domain-containing protein [Desulfospira joergensenii]|uniref:hotdog fold thioesterase n=1 Tax=Desulfospira joergensenii TaxID=53329 RepID=UPI0003B4B39E|nr:beta-ketoacyl synthase N-terminal-like domain-containing protein [Desulfospira joergensenii]